jgi:predicted nuclease with TOPRIM domain
VSQEFENIVTSPQGTKMSHAKAAELRNRNQQLEEQCDGWKKKYDELERRHRELERKCQDLEKNLADAVAVGADWSNMSFSH